MGRSTSSCFKIISCGCINESVDQTHVSSQNKGHDKPGWSFGKKSSPSQVPSNTVVTEKISSTSSKEIPEPITISSESKITSNISEKTPDNIWAEEAPNSITKNAAVSATATKTASEEDDVKCEPVPDESESESEYESAVFVIQAAVRRFLAERQLVKHKNVVKLQAAVRGHLVRNHAVGTLRCVQAIVKMQALVRARREKGVQNAGINATPTHVSIEKLLSNRLARQLLESTPKTKQINIKCDPSKSDSAWNWLERWMSVSAPETLQPHTPDRVQDKVVNFTETANVGSSDLRKPDNEVVACADVGSTAPRQAMLVTDAEPRDDSSRVVQNGGLECGTELSITSTLDSPDQFETENQKSEEVKVLNDAVDNDNNSVVIAVPGKQVDEKLDDTDTELEPESSHHVDKSNEHEPPFQPSVTDSPQSHMTNLESQGTPSSQISTTSKKTRSDKKVSSQTQTRKSWSYSKKSSPVSSSVDSGLRSSLEQLPKDPKPVKRRIATGSPKPDHSDHEPSVPGYMQATESARAKAVATISPRSSPDVHDKETYSKKRHSLPSTVNSRQDSPRMQRSLTQALQTTKGNGNQERKWLR
ncbi:putative IQ motif, EF-hand binding protein [Helianthus debilis subsp. tardiflorus]